MPMERAALARTDDSTRKPTGLRRLTPGLLQADRLAESFAGLPEGVTGPAQLLAAFKAAAPRLALPIRLVHAIDWLFRFTHKQDWERGVRPIVWPSAAMQAEALGLSPSQVKAINRQLIEAGLVSMKDSPNGKRYGQRDATGRILEAYGFDLSPLAARHEEFLRTAEAARAEREEMRKLRRRATIARNGITQILETAAEAGYVGEEWAALERETQNLVRGCKDIERPDALALIVHGLERRQRAARERLENLLGLVVPTVRQMADSNPSEPENRPHKYKYKSNPYPEQESVTAMNACSGRSVDAFSNKPRENELSANPRLGTEELVRYAPRLKSYLHSPAPGWGEIITAADWLRHDLGISKPLWDQACRTIGHEQAAVALAIVAAKPVGHFRTTPGGYFHGMVAKAKAGELHLMRTIWAWRAEARADRRGKT